MNPQSNLELFSLRRADSPNRDSDNTVPNSSSGHGIFDPNMNCISKTTVRVTHQPIPVGEANALDPPTPSSCMSRPTTADIIDMGHVPHSHIDVDGVFPAGNADMRGGGIQLSAVDTDGDNIRDTVFTEAHEVKSDVTVHHPPPLSDDHKSNDSGGVAFTNLPKRTLLPYWVADTGATQHVTNKKESIINLRTGTLDPLEGVSGPITVSGVGDVILDCQTGTNKDDKSVITLRNVRYCPDAPCSLLSLAELFKEHDGNALFNKEGVTYYYRNRFEPIMKGLLIERFTYVVDVAARDAILDPPADRPRITAFDSGLILPDNITGVEFFNFLAQPGRTNEGTRNALDPRRTSAVRRRGGGKDRGRLRRHPIKQHKTHRRLGKDSRRLRNVPSLRSKEGKTVDKLSSPASFSDRILQPISLLKTRPESPLLQSNAYAGEMILDRSLSPALSDEGSRLSRSPPVCRRGKCNETRSPLLPSTVNQPAINPKQNGTSLSSGTTNNGYSIDGRARSVQIRGSLRTRIKANIPNQSATSLPNNQTTPAHPGDHTRTKHRLLTRLPDNPNPQRPARQLTIHKPDGLTVASTDKRTKSLILSNLGSKPEDAIPLTIGNESARRPRELEFVPFTITADGDVDNTPRFCERVPESDLHSGMPLRLRVCSTHADGNALHSLSDRGASNFSINPILDTGAPNIDSHTVTAPSGTSYNRSRSSYSFGHIHRPKAKHGSSRLQSVRHSPYPSQSTNSSQAIVPLR